MLWGLIPLLSTAQQARPQVSGTVRDDLGEVLPNASVVALNEKTKYSAGVRTDTNGVFRFSGLPEEGHYTFSVSYVGFETQQRNNVVLKNGATITFAVKLARSTSTLNDIVVIGYGTAKRKNVVGSFNVVSIKEVGNTAATNPSQLLIGKAAGVQVVQSGGPGADAQILIRGTGTFTDVNPLYVVDGIQGTKNLFNSLNTQDIENITILKDASSTAIYGSAAANGVVIITTKKGKLGPPRLTLSSQWGISKAWKQLDLLKAKDYVSVLQDLAASKNSVLPGKFSTDAVMHDSTDWQKAVFRNALVNENDLNIIGAGERVTYSVSATYITQQSILQHAVNKRLQARASLEENFGRFRFTQNVMFRQYIGEGYNANLQNALQYAPYKPIKDPSIQGGYSIVSTALDFSSIDDPYQEIYLKQQTSNSMSFFPQLSGEVRLIDGLRFRSQFAGEVNSIRSTTYQPQYQSSNYLNQARQSGLNFTQNSYYMWENYLSYDKQLGARHSISLTAGESYIDPGRQYASGIRGTGQPNDNITGVTVAPNQAVTTSYDNYFRPSLISYYGRASYTYNDRYTLSGSYRRDGASNFGANNRWGNFSAAGASWRFSAEDFIKRSFPALSEGKLRIGWGQTGNNNIPNFLNTSKIYQGSPTGALVYSLGATESFISGVTLITLSNPDLKWEQTAQTDAGLDLSFFRNRLSVVADWYDRKSTGLLVTTFLPASVGVSPTGTQPKKTLNAASVDNKGVELTIGYNDKITEDFGFNISVNGSVNTNKVRSLGAQFNAPIQGGAFGPVPATTYTAAGSVIGSFYGYRVDHVARDANEIAALDAQAAKQSGTPGAKYQDGLLPGDFIYKDLNHDGVVNTKDQEILGNPIPRYIYGINAGITYKAFDLNVVLSGISGMKLLNGMKLYTQAMQVGHNATTAIMDHWRNPGDVAALPRLGQSATGSGNLRPSDWWLENGAYLRARNITVGYTAPAGMLGKISKGTVKNFRVYVAAQNLFTITKYSGYDPEVVGSDLLFNRGIDLGQIPQPRTFLAGVQVGF